LNRRVLRAVGLEGHGLFFSRSASLGSPAQSPLLWMGDQLVSWDAHDGIKSALLGMLQVRVRAWLLRALSCCAFRSTRQTRQLLVAVASQDAFFPQLTESGVCTALLRRACQGSACRTRTWAGTRPSPRACGPSSCCCAGWSCLRWPTPSSARTRATSPSATRRYVSHVEEANRLVQGAGTDALSPDTLKQKVRRVGVKSLRPRLSVRGYTRAVAHVEWET
jgi:hypothetical protein